MNADRERLVRCAVAAVKEAEIEYERTIETLIQAAQASSDNFVSDEDSCWLDSFHLIVGLYATDVTTAGAKVRATREFVRQLKVL